MPGRIISEPAVPPGTQRSIMWLPPRDQVPRVHTLKNVAKKMFDHPVVVVSSAPKGGKVDVFGLTTRDNTPLTEPRDMLFRNREKFLPIHPNDPHPDSQRLLHLERGRELREKTFVKIRGEAAVISLDQLRPWERGALTFTQTSFLEILEVSGYTPEVVAVDPGADLRLVEVAEAPRRTEVNFEHWLRVLAEAQNRMVAQQREVYQDVATEPELEHVSAPPPAYSEAMAPRNGRIVRSQEVLAARLVIEEESAPLITPRRESYDMLAIRPVVEEESVPLISRQAQRYGAIPGRPSSIVPWSNRMSLPTARSHLRDQRLPLFRNHNYSSSPAINWSKILKKALKIGAWIVITGALAYGVYRGTLGVIHLVQALARVIGNAWHGMISGIQHTFQRVGQWFAVNWNGVVSSVYHIFSRIGQWFAESWHGVASGVKHIAEVVVKWVKGLLAKADPFHTMVGGSMDKAKVMSRRGAVLSEPMRTKAQEHGAVVASAAKDGLWSALERLRNCW